MSQYYIRADQPSSVYHCTPDCPVLKQAWGPGRAKYLTIDEDEINRRAPCMLCGCRGAKEWGNVQNRTRQPA